MIDTSILRNEIISNSKYANLVANGQDADIANTLNAPDDAISINLKKLDRECFVSIINQAAGLIPTLSTSDQAGWTSRLNLIFASLNVLNTVDLTDSHTQAFLTGAVQSNLLTQVQVNALVIRAGSRAEQLFGIDTVVNQSDISFALRGQR